MTFVDDCTRMAWVYQSKQKSDVCFVFRLFYQMVTTQFGTSIKILQPNNGGKYFKQELIGFMHYNVAKRKKNTQLSEVI